MEAATVAAVAVVAPLTYSGYTHLKGFLRTGSTRLGALPTSSNYALANPSRELRITGSHGGSLGGNVTLSLDGEPAGSYSVFNGEIILVGDDPSSLKAVAAIGGAKVTSQAQTVSIVPWEAPRELTLRFSSEQEAAEWAKTLREAAKLPQFPCRLDMLIDHIHMQDMHKMDLQKQVQKIREDHVLLERQLEEVKLEGANSAGSPVYQVGTVYRVESDNPLHKLEHNGLAYRRSMNFEDKVEELARWGTTVTGIDLGNGWIQVGEKFLPMAVGDGRVLTASDPSTGSFKEHVANLNRELQLALRKKDEAEEGQQLSVQQVCELRHAVEQAATAGGQQELLDVLRTAEASTSGASRELLEMFEAAEARKFELEERARILEKRLELLEAHGAGRLGLAVRDISAGFVLGATENEDHACMIETAEARRIHFEERARILEERLELLETRGAGPQGPVAQDTSAGFVLDATENEDHARMFEVAEARRTQLEDRTREIELQMERLEQMRQQEPSEAAGTSALTARIAQLEATLLQRDQEVEQHLHHLEGEKRSEVQRLRAWTAQLEAGLAEKERQIEELRAHLAELASPQASAHAEGVHEDGLQAIMLNVAEVHGRAQLQATQVQKAAPLFERHATELEQLRQDSGAAPHEAGGPVGELQRLHAEAAAATRDAEAARSEKQALNEQLADAQASLQRAADAESRAAELQDTLAAKEELVSQLLGAVKERDQEIMKLAQVVDLQQSSAMADASQHLDDDMEESHKRASLAEAKVAELSAIIQERDERTVQLSATVAAMEQEIESLRSAQLPPDVEELLVWARGAEAREAEFQASIDEREAERAQLIAGVTAMEQKITQLQAEVVTQAEQGRGFTLGGAHEELTNRAMHAEARAKEFEELANKREEELIRVEAMVAGSEQELTLRITHADRKAAEAAELATRREEEVTRLKETVAEMVHELTGKKHHESRATEFEELARSREVELFELKGVIAGMEQELASKKHHESRAAEFEELARSREAELFELKDMIAGMEPELASKKHHESRATEFEELARSREAELLELKVAIAEMEQELASKRHHEGRATEFEEVARRRDGEILQLKGTVARMEQELTQRTHALRSAAEFEELAVRKEEEVYQLKETVAGLEQELTQRTHALRSAAEFEELAISKEEEVSQLKKTVAGLEQELALHRSSHLERASQVTELEAQLQRMKGVEADALAAQARLQEKDTYISQLKQDVSSFEHELAHLQAQQAEAHEVGKQALLQQTSLAEAHMQTAKKAEDMAAHFSALADQKARHVEQLELSASHLQQELARLHAAAAERAGADEAGRRGLLLQARAAEDIARGEGLQETADKVRAREEQRAKRFEEEKAALQRQLEAQFEVEYATVRKDAADAQAGLEASRLEREALKGKLEQVQANEAQRAKFFEEEKATLRRHLAEQFETEYTAMRKKATAAEMELRNLFLERDALRMKLEQAQVEQRPGEQELPPAVVQRLDATENAANESKAKLQVVEQELLVAYQTIERQAQEHAQLHSRRSQAQQLEAQLRQLEQDKLALQEQLAQRTEVTSPPQLHRLPAEALQQPQLGSSAVAAGPFAAQGLVGGKQPQSPGASLHVPMSTAGSAMSTVSSLPGCAAPALTTAVQASAAPLQSLLLPGGTASTLQVRAQEPLGAGLMFAGAACQMQAASQLVSPMRQRSQELNSPAANAVALQRAASPAMPRPHQPSSAPAVPVFAMQTAAAKPVARSSFASTGPGVALAAAAAPPWAAQPVLQPVPLQGMPTGSHSGRLHLDQPTPPSAEKGSRKPMADAQHIQWSTGASADPSALRQVPLPTTLRPDSGAALSASMAQAPEMASLLQPVSPCSGIISSLGSAPTDLQSGMRN